jgi:type II secretory pathway pseudopilin PulG
LVVIAIIAILAAMLLPVLARAKVKAKATQCLNNMKQLQICWQMYCDDNTDRLPPNGTQAMASSWVDVSAQSDTTPVFIEAGLLYQYNKSDAIYACPANERRLRGRAILACAHRHPGAHAPDLLDKHNAWGLLQLNAARWHL